MISAPGKLILCGEHAVVYGRPAIAMPLSGLRASVAIERQPAGSGLTVAAPDLGERWQLQAAAPLAALARSALERLGAGEPDALLTIRSEIPIASGMGSGAAVGAALVRALAELAGAALGPEAVSALVYESERQFHGTPSGIDNTVVAYEEPVLYIRQPELPPSITSLRVGGPWHFVIGDTGVVSSTKAVVGDLRRRWGEEPARYEPLFDAIGHAVMRINNALRADDGPRIGALLDENHRLLQAIGVSSPELDGLAAAARAAGAWGAKMSGAGWGGVMLALVAPGSAAAVAAALREAGATQIWTTELARDRHA